MSVTLKQMAQRLGLHVSTVSRAMHGHPNLSKNTVDRIQSLAQELGYQPNQNAIRFRTGRSMIVGIIVPRLANLFYESFIAAAEEEARKIGYTVMLLQSMEDTAIENENLKVLKSYKVDAILVSPTIRTKDFTQFLDIQNAGIPIILFDSVPSCHSFSKVLFDNHKVGALAAKCFIRKQCSNVLGIFCNNDYSVTTSRRLEGFNEVIDRADSEIKLKPHYHTTVSDAKDIVLKTIREGEEFDAIFCASDNAFIGAIKAMEYARNMYTKKCALVTVSNGFIPTLFDFDISIIETNGYDLGRAAIGEAMNALNGKVSYKTTLLDVVIKEPQLNHYLSLQ